MPGLGRHGIDGGFKPLVLIAVAVGLAGGSGGCAPARVHGPGGQTAGTVDLVHSRTQVVPVAPAHRMRRLTVGQFNNAIGTLLGLRDAIPEIESDQLIDGFASVGASEGGISGRGAELFEKAGRTVAQRVFTYGDRPAELEKCAPETASEPCVQEYLRAFTERAWRRRID